MSVPQTQQELFDAVARHLLTQKVRSGDGPANCLYRGPDGRKCAMGIFIPDADYQPRMETVSIIVPLVWDTTGLSRGLERAAQDLQAIHDSVDPGMWADNLRWYARRRALNPAVLNEVYP